MVHRVHGERNDHVQDGDEVDHSAEPAHQDEEALQNAQLCGVAWGWGRRMGAEEEGRGMWDEM